MVMVTSAHGKGAGDHSAPSPWENDSWGSYERIADADEGQWHQQLSPDSSGFGLMVMGVQPDTCCWPSDSLQGALRDAIRAGEPWLLPALVHWSSGIDPTTGKPHQGLYGPGDGDNVDEIEAPPVVINDIWVPDDTNSMLLVNTTGNVESQWEQSCWDTGLLPAVGIAAPWQILPISEKDYRTWHGDFLDACNEFSTNMLGYSNCDISNMYGESEEWEACHCSLNGPAPDDIFDHSCRCDYVLGESHCNCGHPPTQIQLYTALRDSDLQGRELLPESAQTAWADALDRYVAGLKTIHHNKEAGDAWSSSSWRRLSPFSDSASLVVPAPRPLHHSTGSGTQLAFSVAS
jgi:hypothetical protein